MPPLYHPAIPNWPVPPGAWHAAGATTTRLALFTQRLRSLARADAIPNVSAAISATTTMVSATLV